MTKIQRGTGQDVASTEHMHESGPASALHWVAVFACVRQCRAQVCPGRLEAGCEGRRTFRHTQNLVVASGRVPGVENHAFRFEGIKRSADVRLKLRVGQRDTERRRLAY